MTDSFNAIYGPPGTGKTTKLLDIMETFLTTGGQPENIGFFSFTKKAVEEARSRSCNKFDLTTDRFPWFRTLHSLAFKQLGLQRAQVVNWEARRDFASRMKLNLTFNTSEASYGFTTHDRMMGIHDIARVRGVSLREAYDERGDELDWLEIEFIARGYEKYKTIHHLYDFTDMGLKLLEKPHLIPTFDLLLIDEAQDISTLMWKIITIMKDKATMAYVAGDDDQALYTWNGADPEQFATLNCPSIVLNKSYRVPRAHQEFAQAICGRIKVRKEKQWEPRDEEGTLKWIASIDEVDFSKGSWFVLARNRYHLAEFPDILRTQGIYFDMLGTLSVKESVVTAITAWESMRKGSLIDRELAATALKFIPGKFPMIPNEMVGLKDYGIEDLGPWFEALSLIPDETIEYIRAMRRNGEVLSNEPRVRLSTVHGVKGGEADSVVLLDALSWMTAQNYEKRPDEEHRVFYVAATRAREGLYLLQTGENNVYDF